MGATETGDPLVSGDTALSQDVPVPGQWLGELAVRLKLHRTEWRVLATILSSPNPVSASSIAKRLHLDYGLVKRVVRELVRWNLLERAAGLTFQPDQTRWGPPRPRLTT